MDELIYRQQAIEAMSELLKRVFPEHRQIAEKCLNALPSAESEVTEEAVKDYCFKRSLTILSNDFFHKLTSGQPLDVQIAYYKGVHDGIEQCFDILKRVTNKTQDS